VCEAKKTGVPEDARFAMTTGNDLENRPQTERHAGLIVAARQFDRGCARHLSKSTVPYTSVRLDSAYSASATKV